MSSARGAVESRLALEPGIYICNILGARTVIGKLKEKQRLEIGIKHPFVNAITSQLN